MKRTVITLLFTALAFLNAQAKVDTLRISSAYTTHVIFSTDLTYADLSNSRFVIAKIIEQNKNMLALKAKEAFTESCSVSALESNGTMHTFIVVYDPAPKDLVIDMRKSQTPQGAAGYVSSTAQLIADVKAIRESHQMPGQGQGAPSGRGNVSTWKTGTAPLLQDVIKEKQHLFHIGCEEYDIQVLCEDISSYSDITYMTISLKNSSGISYDIADATFVIESKRHGKRTVRYDKTVFPRSRYGKLSAGPGEYTRIAYSFEKMTLSKDQVLRIYLYESGGQRNLVMTVDTRDINRARTNI
jgi:hypothetical protein